MGTFLWRQGLRQGWLAWYLPPGRCLLCHSILPAAALCPACAQSLGAPTLPALLWPCQPLVAAPSLAVACAAQWNALFKHHLYAHKFKTSPHSQRVLLALAFRALEALPLPAKAAVWVVHPPSKAGQRNHLQGVCQALCRLRGWRYAPKALAWAAGRSLSQKRAAHRGQRLQQLQGAFVAGPQAKALTQALHHGATVLLLDDLVTTGGTLQACTQALEALAQEAGALLPLQRFCLGFVPQ